MKKNNKDSTAKSTTGTSKKSSSALTAAGKAGSATENVRAKSTRDVNGTAGTRDTGTNTSYEESE